MIEREVSPSLMLKAKLQVLGRRIIAIAFFERFGVFMLALVLGSVLLATVDWFFELSLGFRTASLSLLSLSLAVLAAKAISAFWTCRLGMEQLALRIEKRRADFSSRLISSIQFGSGKSAVPPQALGMVNSLVSETEELAKAESFASIEDTSRLVRRLSLAGMALALAGGGYFIGGGVTQALMKRMMLADVPIPRATKVVVITQDIRVGIGDTIALAATAEGIVPELGQARIRREDGRRERLTMENVNGNQFECLIQGVPESFEYIIHLNDGRSDPYQVTALPRPKIETINGTQHYPKYTGLDNTHHEPGQFLLLPGGQLTLDIHANQAITNGTVHLVGTDQTIKLSTHDDDPKRFQGSFKISTNQFTGFKVHLTSTEGMDSAEGSVYRVDWLRDMPPKIKIVHPQRQEELATRSARFLIKYEVEDRFGVDSVRLYYQVNEGNSKAVTINDVKAKEIVSSHDWKLWNLDPALKAGDLVTYWLEAYDANQQTVAGRSQSLTLRIVSDSEKRRELLSRAADLLGRVELVADEEELLSEQLRELIRGNVRANP
ncbi:MAG: hypothetical protein CL879_03255 [Dehalococcoidia bacterium]|nr:hypothetical protein [Dehalococcoidia bacterium]